MGDIGRGVLLDHDNEIRFDEHWIRQLAVKTHLLESLWSKSVSFRSTLNTILTFPQFPLGKNSKVFFSIQVIVLGYQVQVYKNRERYGVACSEFVQNDLPEKRINSVQLGTPDVCCRSIATNYTSRVERAWSEKFSLSHTSPRKPTVPVRTGNRTFAYADNMAILLRHPTRPRLKQDRDIEMYRLELDEYVFVVRMRTGKCCRTMILTSPLSS